MPAHKPSHPIDVNLLPKDPFSESSLGKFLAWSLSVGRYIVIFTELVVILTFLSRFTLDRQLTNQNESLLNKQALLDAYTDMETQIQDIQTKAQTIDQLEQDPKLFPALEFVLTNTPDTIQFSEVNLRQGKLVITANAFSSKTLSQFVDILRAESQFQNIEIDQLNTSEKDTGIEFIVRTDIVSPSTGSKLSTVPPPSD